MKIVLTGPVHSGKTSLLKKLIEAPELSRVTIDGYLSIAVFADREYVGYDLFSIQDGQTIPFLRKTGRKNWPRIGPYFFLPGGMQEASRIILKSAARDWLIIDEIGPFELSGQGLWPALSTVINSPNLSLLCVVRKPILSDFLESLGETRWLVFDIDDKNIFSLVLDSLLFSSSSR